MAQFCRVNIKLSDLQVNQQKITKNKQQKVKPK